MQHLFETVWFPSRSEVKRAASQEPAQSNMSAECPFADTGFKSVSPGSETALWPSVRTDLNHFRQKRLEENNVHQHETYSCSGVTEITIQNFKMNLNHIRHHTQKLSHFPSNTTSDFKVGGWVTHFFHPPSLSLSHNHTHTHTPLS